MTSDKRKIGVSTAVATLLMIAVAVAAALVTYAWVMGYLGGTTAKVSKAITIQSVALDTDNNFTIYVLNVGNESVTLKQDQAVYIDGILTAVDLLYPSNGVIEEGATATITISHMGSLADAKSHIIRIVALEGTFMEVTVPKITAGSGIWKWERFCTVYYRIYNSKYYIGILNEEAFFDSTISNPSGQTATFFVQVYAEGLLTKNETFVVKGNETANTKFSIKLDHLGEWKFKASHSNGTILDEFSFFVVLEPDANALIYQMKHIQNTEAMAEEALKLSKQSNSSSERSNLLAEISILVSSVIAITPYIFKSRRKIKYQIFKKNKRLPSKSSRHDVLYFYNSLR